jgi:hypothetical protein
LDKLRRRARPPAPICTWCPRHGSARRSNQCQSVLSEEENAENNFALRDLAETLKMRNVPVNEHDAPPLLFFRVDSKQGASLLESIHLQFDPAMNDEGYVIAPAGVRSIVVIAKSASGFFYGAQTVKQLIRGSGKDTVFLVPTIRDWPAMAHRGLSDDWSRGPLPNMEFLKREIRTLAAYKINIFSPYFEHTFAYDSTPVAAFPGGAMTPDEARELVAYATQYHITVIPEQESFGHLHHLLKFEQFSALGETAHGSVLAPGDSATLPLIGEWFSELAKVFPAPYAHIGADETFELGLGKTREQVQQQGLGAVYIDFLKQIHATLEPNHKRLLFWGDIAVHSPELVGTLPKDMIRALGLRRQAGLQADHCTVYQGGAGDLGGARREQLEPPLPQQQRRAGKHSRLCARRPGSGRHGRDEHRVERRRRGHLRRELVWRAVWRGGRLADRRKL